MEKAPLWLNWKIQQLLIDKNLKKADQFEKVAQGMVKLLNKLSDGNQRSYYISYCAEILAQGDARLLTLYIKNLQTQLSKPLTKLSTKNKQKTFIKPENLNVNNLLKEAETILLKIYIHYPQHRQEIFNKLEEKSLIFSLSDHRIIWHKLLEIEENILNIDDANNQQFISQIEANMADLSEVASKVKELLNFREIEQYEDSNRLNLIIEAALISLEKVNLEKYCNYCEQKYKKINSQEDPVNYQYYLNEYLSSKQKILQLQPLRSFSQLDIYS